MWAAQITLEEASTVESKPRHARRESAVLLSTVFIVGLCTIVYELLIGSVSSYFLGDSVKQFSLTIGLTMSAMGIGTWLSRKIEGHLLERFILVELLLGLLGGLSVPILYFTFSHSDFYYPVMMILILMIGILIGLEIPLLTRVMEKNYSLRENISNVLSLDYVGALAATLLFPFVFLPFLGVFKSSLVIGSVNVLVALLNYYCFREQLPKRSLYQFKWLGIAGFVILIGLFSFSQTLVHGWENEMYEDRVIFSKQSNYQKIVVTKNKDDYRLYLDGSLQFSSIDEHRYHEALVHTPLSMMKNPKSILVLGGGDGLAIRELLKYSEIEKIDLVDLDPEITKLGQHHHLFKRINKGSLANNRVQVFNDDAFLFLEKAQKYDLIIGDLPDPKSTSLARLYSREFFERIKSRLKSDGIFVTQATSPFFAKKAFWSIHKTLEISGFASVHPYHVYVPSFGDWGFVMASLRPYDRRQVTLKVETRYLDPENLNHLFNFAKDVKVKTIKPNSLNQPHLLGYYLSEWEYWN